MEDIAIQAVNLGKLYYIGARAEATVFKRVGSLLTGAFNTRPLWALRGLNLSIRRGECVGIIGPNGAGKTTLLMLLSGLLAPTEGSVSVCGRVSPFFNIGSGLHSELTVLDNIRLAGALFGMTREELRRKIDAIIAFGGLEEYVYARLGELSAGYQGRVPFSTALHSDIDILMTDEVFAAGDAAFCKKCLDRMGELMKRGKTAVIASHSMELISDYCTRVLVLERGALRLDGDVEKGIAGYLFSQGLLTP
ncbi:MAG: ABC transporter ATP-binding protein [Elusimicrobia bacterium]|nr:ABC transporter ATP-binding protein [Elusimicrobiota bacterium]